MSDPLFQFWVPIWAILAGTLIWRHWQDRQVGLLFTYILSLASIYLIAPAMHLLPDYEAAGAEDTAEGLRMSAFALMALWVGAEIMVRLLARRHRETSEREVQIPEARLATIAIVGGVVIYFVLSPIVGRTASLTALVSTGSTLVVVGFCLKCWTAWAERASLRLWLWLLGSLAFPLATLTFQGFLGYGLGAAATIMAFAAGFYRPRWKVIVFGAVMAYAALSLYVTYMRDRAEIRASVWGGETFEQRMDRLGATFALPELFDVRNPDHLARIEDRLNQNALIGMAVVHIRNGFATFANGTTFRDAMLSPIPRALWPNKPIVAGSGDLVSEYTGLRFAEGTSVGVGHVLEAYINFGTVGVALVFLCLGGVLVLVDSVAYRHLRSGNGRAFMKWYLPGLGVLQVGGSLSEATAFAAAAWVMASLIGFAASGGAVGEPELVEDSLEPAPHGEREEVV